MKQVDVYTDGACSGNPGPGGWAAILIYKGQEKELSGFLPDTTNNQMELKGPIEALIALKEPCEVTIYTDSNYVCKAFNDGWIENWQKNGWKNAAKDPVENQDYWKMLLLVSKKHSVKYVKVKGHSDNRVNNRCDKLAKEAIAAHRNEFSLDAGEAIKELTKRQIENEEKANSRIKQPTEKAVETFRVKK